MIIAQQLHTHKQAASQRGGLAFKCVAACANNENETTLWRIKSIKNSLPYKCVCFPSAISISLRPRRMVPPCVYIMWTRNIRIRRIGRVVFLLAPRQCPRAEAKSSTKKLCFPFWGMGLFIFPWGINSGEIIVACRKYEYSLDLVGCLKLVPFLFGTETFDCSFNCF